MSVQKTVYITEEQKEFLDKLPRSFNLSEFFRGCLSELMMGRKIAEILEEKKDD